MNKEALLNIILSDINEVETLLKSFQGSEEIPEAFIDLTERKLNHLVEEFSLLKSINNTAPVKPNIKQEKTQEPEPKIEVETNQPSNIPTQEPIIIEAQQEVIEEKETIEEKVIPQEKTETFRPTIEVEKPISEIKEEKVISEPAKVVESTTESESIQVNETEVLKETPVESKQEIIETPKPTTNIQIEKKEIKEESSKTLGETLVSEKKSVNDIISNNKESKIQQTLIGKPIQDLTKSLGLNDRFMFQRELFEGNADIMKQTLLQLNEMPDFNSAQAFISSNFSWDQEQEATQAFFNYVKRKFY